MDLLQTRLEIQGAQPGKYQRRRAIIFRAGGVMVFWGRFSWAIGNQVCFQSTTDSASGWLQATGSEWTRKGPSFASVTQIT